MVDKITFASTKPNVSQVASADRLALGDEASGDYTFSFVTTGNLFANPLPIGSGTANTGAFTTLAADSLTVGGVNPVPVVGTWTPTLYGATTAGTTTYSNPLGNYIRIGNLMYIDLRLVWSNATGTGAARIGGLPVNIFNRTFYRPAISVGYYNGLALPSGKVLGGYGQEGSDYIILLNTSNTTMNDPTDLQSELTASGEIYLSMIYQI